MFFWSPSQAAAILPKIYDEIAEEFALSREKEILTDMEFLAEGTKEGATILDIGVGSGRTLPLLFRRHCRVFGIDLSEKLLEKTHEKYPSGTFVSGEFTKIPFPDEKFDEVWAIASFHHLPTEELRKKAFQEIKRVLKPKGELILTVWNIWEEDRLQDVRMKAFWRTLFLPQWHRSDMLIPWGKHKFPRYYHAFTVSEMEELIRAEGFLVLQYWGGHHKNTSSETAARNFCWRLQKK
jgi:ubiquinone/menaquinone biosynthesis C-methylase UbiE